MKVTLPNVLYSLGSICFLLGTLVNMARAK